MPLRVPTSIPIILVAALLVAASISACSTPTEGGPTVKTIYVGPKLVDCVGVAPMKCMQVKEDPEAEWTLWYDPIVGFNYEEGYEYELVVEEVEVENPPADASSLQYHLVEEVAKTPVD